MRNPSEIIIESKYYGSFSKISPHIKFFTLKWCHVDVTFIIEKWICHYFIFSCVKSADEILAFGLKSFIFVFPKFTKIYRENFTSFIFSQRGKWVLLRSLSSGIISNWSLTLCGKIYGLKKFSFKYAIYWNRSFIQQNLLRLTDQIGSKFCRFNNVTPRNSERFVFSF